METVVSDKTLYFHYCSETDKRGLLSGKIWNDLNGEALFTRVDRTASAIGRQFLYKLLHYDRLSGVECLEKVIEEFSGDKAMRKEVQQTLQKLDTPDAYRIISLITEAHVLPVSWPIGWLYTLQLLPFLFLGLLYVTSSVWFVPLLALSVVGNLWLHYRNKSWMQTYSFSIPCLWRLLKLSGRLLQYPFAQTVGGNIANTLKVLRPLQKKLAVFRFSVRLESDMAILAWFVIEILNILLLREVISVAKAFRLLRGKRQELHSVFCFWGMVDVLCSVAELREELPYHTRPTDCREGESFHVGRLYHPLVEDCVPNSLTLCGQSVLITGSNMSGKTTFIRSVGVSVLCGKVLNTCFAETFRLLRGTTFFSAIHVEDDLLEGRSLFLQEVQVMKNMLEKGEAGHRLFLLDELFKGTNTIERIAIAKAVLSALAKHGNIVFASTHDIELASLLADQYSLYHFCENVSDNKLQFDYLLKPGPVTERNAIRIIELYGYPSEVIEEAHHYADSHYHPLK